MSAGEDRCQRRRTGQAAGSKATGQDGRRETLGERTMLPFGLYSIQCFPYIVFSYEHVLSHNQKKRIQPEITPNIPQHFPGPQPPAVLGAPEPDPSWCIMQEPRGGVSIVEEQSSPEPSDQLRRTPDSRPTSPPADREEAAGARGRVYSASGGCCLKAKPGPRITER